MNRPLRRAGWRAFAYALALISAGIGLTWLGLALDRWFGAAYPGWAALAIAGVFLAPLIAVALHYRAERKARIEAERQRALARQVTHHALADHARQFLRGRPLLTLAATAAAGLTVARFPGAASVLARLVTPRN